MNPKIHITNLKMYEKIDVYATLIFIKESYLELESWSLMPCAWLIGSLSYMNVNVWTWIGYSPPYAMLTMQHHMQTIIKTKENQKKETKVQMFYTIKNK